MVGALMKPIGKKLALTNEQNRARGAVVVEMAVLAPLLLTIMLGIIEFGWVFMVRQTMTTAARGGARVATLQGTTETDIEDRVNDYMSPSGLSTYTITITRATEEDPTETVRIQIPYADVSLVGGYFGPTNFNLSATSSMRKEGV
jgi:Flp pilus assembly protein TadG